MRLNMSRVVRSRHFNDSFDVVKRTTTLVKGRTVVSPTTITGVKGVVTNASPNDLERLPDVQRMDHHISIVTEYVLQGALAGRQPDLVVWRGNTYQVNSVDPYPQFGPGFYQVLAGSVTTPLNQSE